MRLLFVGDIVGPQAVDWVCERLPRLKSDHAIDMIVANAENANVTGTHAHNGFGMTVTQIETLFAAGVDVITSGNHAWDGPEADAVLAQERVLRPFNLPEGLSGHGVTCVEVLGQPVTVVNVADEAAIPTALPLAPAWEIIRPALHGTVIVDFHGGNAMLKHIAAHGLDGQVAAVLGTHTHEATLHTPILPGGTAFVADVGMTGPLGGGQGIASEWFVGIYQNENTPPFSLATGPLTLGAVLLDIEDGKTRAIRRVE